MVKIGRCNSCGQYTSEIWKERDNCPSCGGPMDHIDVDIGTMEHLPRIMNIGGLILLVLAVIVFIAEPAGNNGGDGVSGPLFLIIASIALFFVSLISQNLLSGLAMRKRERTLIREKKVSSRQSARSTGKGQEESRKMGRKILK